MSNYLEETKKYFPELMEKIYAKLESRAQAIEELDVLNKYPSNNRVQATIVALYKLEGNSNQPLFGIGMDDYNKGWQEFKSKLEGIYLTSTQLEEIIMLFYIEYARAKHLEGKK